MFLTFIPHYQSSIHLAGLAPLYYIPGKCQVLSPSIVVFSATIQTIKTPSVVTNHCANSQVTITQRERRMGVLVLSASLTEHCTASVSVPSTHS